MKHEEMATGAPEITLVPASRLRRYPTNRKPREDKVKAMAESIREVGVIQPLIGRPDPDGGEGVVQLVAGETRWLGASLVDAEYPVPVHVRDLDDKQAAKLHATENFQRADLNVIEEAREVQHMRYVGMEFDEIALHLGRAVSWAYNRLTLLNLPEIGIRAVEDGTMSPDTAGRIAGLPEELREKAVESVIAPKNLARPMTRSEALAHIQKDFVEPLEREKEWNEKRPLLEREHPGCVWLEYDEACRCPGYTSEYEPADEMPNHSELSDAARCGEIVVPTWGELAKRHGAPVYIGRNWDGKTRLWVKNEPLIDAEKAACDDRPGECVFTHAGAARQAREASEKRRMEQERVREAVRAERHRFAVAVLEGKVPKAAVKELAVDVCDALRRWGALEDLEDLLEIQADPEGAADGRAEMVSKAVGKMLRAKGADAFEVLGRLVAAECVEAMRHDGDLADMGFRKSAMKPDAYPALHEVYLENEARKARAERDDAESARAAQADGEEAA